ncbi:protein mesh-like isoform X2 [Paramacrobiotus metropolitanus]|uniref:protein mesh-like isoform X2 n=1 Tax=Paramacrobiotus metropolitanus TaxID=2943436 RepID=UPI0024462F4A|nr:protein mesh-like isoform X2 [Paramacrobiotus metropolitanus]
MSGWTLVSIFMFTTVLCGYAQVLPGDSVNSRKSLFAQTPKVSKAPRDAQKGPAYAAPMGGGVLGGEMVNVTVPCSDPSQVRCKFGRHETAGFCIDHDKAKCQAPMTLESGWLPFAVSVDGVHTYNTSGEFFVAPHGQSVARVNLRNLDDWYSENPLKQLKLTVEWKPREMTWTDRIQIDIGLWGYQEEADRSVIQFIANIALNLPKEDGQYSFYPHHLVVQRPTAKFTQGFIRISASNALGKTSHEYPHLWSEMIPLAWYFHKQWRQDFGDDYAGQFCRDWYYSDRALPEFISSLEPCPCTMEQAKADKGRFTLDVECDSDRVSACNFHKGAIHCVYGRVQPSTGAGQECCYDGANGRLLINNKWRGSPNRVHPYGAPTDWKSPKVPSLSNWLHDKMPWLLCCQWSDNCDYYSQYRLVSQDCGGYKNPGAAIIYGAAHVITFDKVQYTFPGLGDYILLQSDLPHFAINVQVRLQKLPNEHFGNTSSTFAKAVVMQEDGSDIVEIRANENKHEKYRHPNLPVFVNGQPGYFNQSWLKMQQFKGVWIHDIEYAPQRSNLVVRFLSGIAVEVHGRQGRLHVTAYVPPEIKNHTYGLFGKWNGIPKDDLTTTNGIEVSTTASTRSIYSDFARTWQVKDNSDTEEPESSFRANSDHKADVTQRILHGTPHMTHARSRRNVRSTRRRGQGLPLRLSDHRRP